MVSFFCRNKKLPSHRHVPPWCLALRFLSLLVLTLPVACEDDIVDPAADPGPDASVDPSSDEAGDCAEDLHSPTGLDLNVPLEDYRDPDLGKPGVAPLGPLCAVNYPLLFGHRGVAWNFVGNPYPENTLLSVQAALQMGAPGVEIDVTKTKDGVVVLAHENKLDYVKDGVPKTSCKGTITSSNYADIAECIINSSTPDGYTTSINTFDELIEMPGQFEVALDIKNDNLGIASLETVDVIIETILAHEVQHRFMLMLYEESSVRYALQRVPRVCHKRHTMGGQTLEQVLKNLEEMGATCLCVNEALLDEPMLEGLMNLGVQVIPYALGEQRSLDELVELIKLYSRYDVYALLTEHLAETLAFRDRCAEQ